MFTSHGFVSTCEQIELSVCYRYTIMVGSTKYCSFLFTVSSSIQSVGLWYWGQTSKAILHICCLWKASICVISFYRWFCSHTALSGFVIHTYPVTAGMVMETGIFMTSIVCCVALNIFIWSTIVDGWNILSCY